MNYNSSKRPRIRNARGIDPALRLMTAVILTARSDYAKAYRRSIRLRGKDPKSYEVLQNERELRELRSFFLSLLGLSRARRILRDMEQIIENGGSLACEHRRRDARQNGGNPIWS